MANEWDPNDIFDVLADHRVRSILLATYEQRRSVQDLEQHCNGSLSSLYRRVDVLVEYSLLDEQTIINPDGHHYSVYETQFEDICITPDSEFSFSISIRNSKKEDIEIIERCDSFKG